MAFSPKFRCVGTKNSIVREQKVAIIRKHPLKNDKEQHREDTYHFVRFKKKYFLVHDLLFEVSGIILNIPVPNADQYNTT